MAENYVLLETVQLTATTSSVVFDNIPQTGYTDLVIRLSSRENSASVWNNLGIAFNGSGTYYAKSVVGTGGATTSQSSSALDRQYANGGSTTANTFGNGEIYIPNYAGSLPKVISSSTVGENNSTTSVVGLMAGLFTSTSAITTITLTVSGQSFVTGSTFSLYGISASGTSPTTAPKASGGNIVANDGTYWYHAFLSSGTFTPLQSLTCDVMQVAGGGSGGRNPAGGGSGGMGGGGAGGLLVLTSQSLTSTNYPVTVGAGGTNVPTGRSNGSNSQFGSLTAAVGGGGGGIDANSLDNGANGGSGGGSAYSGTKGLATAGQGNDGGNGFFGGSGGGAGAAGTTGTQFGAGAAGGAGSSAYSSWGVATGTGQLVSSTRWFAGGGGSGSTTAGAGGNGGGGTGSAGTTGNAVSGTANTGGGGGGAGGNANAGTAGAGGSGIIIVRYTMA